jgi:signal transduction histidine kinase
MGGIAVATRVPPVVAAALGETTVGGDAELKTLFGTSYSMIWQRRKSPRYPGAHDAAGWLLVLGAAALLDKLRRRHQRRNDLGAALAKSQNRMRRVTADLERVVGRTRQLEAANRELEAFASAVSHDLQAPLRSMSGFSQVLQESAGSRLDDRSRHYLQRIHEASQNMSSLIDGLLELSRISHSELVAQPVSLSGICMDAAVAVRERYPDRDVELHIDPHMNVDGDPRLLRIAMENLLSNAWKYTVDAGQPRITFGMRRGSAGRIFFVRDNGVGFDMAYAPRLFVPFQRLHANSKFPGTGIGLVTVQRIVARHGGRIWAEAQPNKGATFFFTLSSRSAWKP